MQQSLVSWACFPRLSACKGSVKDITEGKLYCKVQTAVKPISEPLFLYMFMAWKEKSKYIHKTKVSFLRSYPKFS